MQTKEVFYDYAKSFLGQPYRWGGDDPVEGVDCSGLVIELLKACGIFPQKEDTTAHGLYKYFPLFSGTPQFGDLVFFGSKEKVSHVGLMLDGAFMLEAGGGDSKTKTRADAAAQNAFVRIRPISIRSDRVGYNRPPYPWRK